MKIAKTRSAALLGLLASLCLTFSANAASTWQFSGSSAVLNGETVANTNYTGTDANLTISGAYAANGAGDVGFANGATTWNTSAPGATTLYFSGNGLGMGSDGQTAPNHALDNAGNTEAVLLSFSTSVVLTSIGIGYKSGDADISLFRFTGTSKTIPTVGPNLSGAGANKAAMLATGWELVGNYGDLIEAKTEPYNLVNSGNKGSSWWLISAYNSSYGAATTGSVDGGNDYFKVYAVAGAKCNSTTDGVCGGRVPEPGSLALASLAIFGAIYTRRQRKADVQS